MQTFLPYPDFTKSAQCLDRARLGKQRIECKQLIWASQYGTGWANHPATKMWRGYEECLARYGIAICDEWIRRGYKDNQRQVFVNFIAGNVDESLVCPRWFGDEQFHASHRSNLLRKAPDHYGQFGWTEPDNLPYIWPEA